MPLAVRVPASTSNLGAGFDCLGLALDLWLEARLIKGPGQPVYRGTLAGMRPADDLVARTLQESGGLAGLGTHWRLEVDSAIPVGKGLGSSAAAVVAGLALAQVARLGRLEPDAIFQRAAQLEGHPDNAGPAVYGGLFLASGGSPVGSGVSGVSGGAPQASGFARLALSPAVAVALAIPEASLDTRLARAQLPAQVPRQVAVAQAARAAALVLGLVRGDGQLIAQGMEDQLAVPYRKDLIPGFDRAVAAGRAAGAYGVTISGAGSSVLALCPPAVAAEVAEAVAEALSAAGNPARPLVAGVAERGVEVE